MNKIVEIKKVYNDSILPTHGSAEAAGYDLYAYIPGAEAYTSVNGKNSIMIAPHTMKKVSAGIAMSIPQGYFGGIFARSGLSTKQGLRPANCTGVIDSDYTGPVIVALYNDSDMTQFVFHGDRIAQLVILPYQEVAFEEVEELRVTERADSGFGSTGQQ